MASRARFLSFAIEVLQDGSLHHHWYSFQGRRTWNTSDRLEDEHGHLGRVPFQALIIFRWYLNLTLLFTSRYLKHRLLSYQQRHQ